MKKISNTIFYASMFSILSCLSALLITQFNMQTKEIYALEDYKENIEILTKENESLRVTISQSEAWGNIDSFVEENNFEKVSSVKYVKVTNPVAVNQ